jgi:hypothetical protein
MKFNSQSILLDPMLNVDTCKKINYKNDTKNYSSQPVK